MFNFLFLVLFSFYFVLDSLFFVEPGINITTTTTTTNSKFTGPYNLKNV